MPDNIQYSGPKYKSANEYGKEVNTSNLYSEPTNYGESVYDDQSISPMMTQSDVDEARAQNQGTLDKLGNGLAHGLTTAGTSFVGGTVGLGNGLLDMMSGKSFYDNATFKLMDEVSQGVNEATPLYQDKSEKEGGFTDSILTNDDFWIDGLFNGLGFIAGGYGSGAVFGKAMGSALKAAKLGQTSKVAEIAAKAGIEDVKGFADKVTSFAEKVPAITAATTGRIYESTLEANQVYESLKDKVASGEISEEDAKQARNAVFASNMALGVVDYFQYAKFLDNFSNHRSSLNKIVKSASGEFIQEAPSQGFKAGVREFAKDSKDVLASMVSEGGEEGTQHIISKTGETGDFSADNFMDSALQAMSDPQFYGAMLSGSLVGGIMGVPNEFGKAKKQNEYTNEVVNLLNNHTDNKGSQILDAKAKLNSYYTIEKAKNELQVKMSNPNISQEEVAVLHDQYRTLEHNQFTNFVQAAVESKTIDNKLEELELLAKEAPEDLAEQAGVTEPKIKNGVPQNPSTQLREKIQKIKEYRQTYEDLQHTYPNVDVPALGIMFKAQTEYNFAEKKLGIVNSKLAEANGKLAGIQSDEIGGTLTSEGAKEQSKLHLESIKNLQAEKEYYENLQTYSVKKFNNPNAATVKPKQKFTVPKETVDAVNKESAQVKVNKPVVEVKEVVPVEEIPQQQVQPIIPTPQVTPESTSQKPTGPEIANARSKRMKELHLQGIPIDEIGEMIDKEFPSEFKGPLDSYEQLLESFEPGNTTGNLERLQSQIDKINSQSDKALNQEVKLVLNTVSAIAKEKTAQKDMSPLTREDVANVFTSIAENQPHLIDRIVAGVNGSLGLVTVPSISTVANTQTIEPVVSTKEIEEEAKEKLFDNTGFKITTGLTAATKIVATDSQDRPLFENGNIKFEDNEYTKDYIKMHTNAVQIGDVWTIELKNDIDEDTPLDDLELELVYTNPETNETESRGFVHKEAYITEDNTTLTGEELQKEKERIRTIRQFYKDGGTGKQVKVIQTTLAKPEFKPRAEVSELEGISVAMMRNVVVYANSQFVSTNGSEFKGDVPAIDDLKSGMVYFMAPQATHVGEGVTHLPILLQ